MSRCYKCGKELTSSADVNGLCQECQTKEWNRILAVEQERTIFEEGENIVDRDKEIIIFTTSGHTFIFKKITNFHYDSLGISFDYEGVSTGVKRHAQFYYVGMAGHAIADML